ncbi:MAG: Bifunctional protein GlmU [Phycisphaerae bacterium]|nr:Bifunctional protein GlmU [Phycisphaerae bacterium]
MHELTAIILAAGKSTRMNSELPKVLHPVNGQPMLHYALQACRQAGVQTPLVVVGYGRDQVRSVFSQDRDLIWIEQLEQLGTGHAVLMCQKALADRRGEVLILAGDMPLIRGEVLAQLVATHRRVGAAVSLATTELSDPTGYGRIIRSANGELQGIREHLNCSEAELRIREVNPSYYCFDAAALLAVLQELRPNPPKGEYYITDAVHLLIAQGARTASLRGLAPEEATGVNTPDELALVHRLMLQRQRNTVACSSGRTA